MFYLHPLIYIAGILNYIYYAKLMKDSMAGGAKTEKLITILGSLIILFALATFFIQYFTGLKYGLTLSPANAEVSPILFSWIGNHKVIPGTLLKINMVLSLITVLILISTMMIGRLKGKYTDGIITFGVLLTASTVFIEMLTPIFFPSHLIVIVFIGNLPEVIRTTYFARRRLVKEMISKERETIDTLVVTLNHELNTPLAVVQAKLDLIKKTQDLSKLDEAISTLKGLKSVLTKLRNLSSRKINRETYREDVGAEESTDMYRL